MSARLLLLVGVLSLAAACAGNRAANRASDADAVDADGIPLSATAAERERWLKERICTTEYPTGSHIPERVCHLPTNSSAYPIEEALRTQGAQSVRGK